MSDKQFISLEVRLIGESENRYQNEAKGIFNGRRHCMKTKVKGTFFTLRLLSDPLFLSGNDS